MAWASTAQVFTHADRVLALTQAVQAMKATRWLHGCKGDVCCNENQVPDHPWLRPHACERHCCQARAHAMRQDVHLHQQWVSAVLSAACRPEEQQTLYLKSCICQMYHCLLEKWSRAWKLLFIPSIP